MGIFDFFKRKSSNRLEDNIDIKDINDINDINEEVAFLRNDIDTTKQYFIDVSDNKNYTEDFIIEEFYKILRGPQDFNSIYNATKRLVDEIGIDHIDNINRYVYEELYKPQEFNNLYKSSEEWNIAVKNIALTSIYSYKSEGVDYLLKIATNPNKDGLKAINLLCKLASNNIDIDKIIDSIIYIMKDFNDIIVIDILKFLTQIRDNQKVRNALQFYFRKYISLNKIEYAYDCVLNSINFNGKFTREELIFLKAMALSEEPVDISLFLDGQEGKIEFLSLDNNLRIKAAITFYSLHNRDEEINIMLKYIKETSEDENLRNYLAEIL